MLGSLAGALVGGAFGYLYLTENGRRVRRELEPRVVDVVSELQRAWEAAEQARDALGQGRKAVP